ncbi:VMAP-C domain-containing protein [Streptomyces daliensis]|uniref:Trypsin-like peptidase domain-containing protein n=1 Tax=Streptomyces daliensis TaxID=299421 RepID=A0A8T4J962_9ACTN|nr:trypsin-like peptidase domain-containing protein [Streptomyces daliensis]
MGWFRIPAAEAADGARRALVGLLADGTRKTSGAGVCLPGRRLLTCAHVVNDALGLDFFEHRHPGQVTLEAVFPAFGPDHSYEARLTTWIPPRATGGAGGPVAPGAHEWAGDLAVLELAEEPPLALPPVRWQEMTAGQEVRSWYGGGQEFSYADVRVGACDGRIGYLDGQLSGAAIGPGYSGGPLWSVQDNAVVGLVAGQVTPPPGALTARHVVRRSWGFTRQTIAVELERAGAAGPAEEPGADILADPLTDDGDTVRDLLLVPLLTLLGDPQARASHSRALAAQFGLGHPADGSAPSVEELAALLVSRERALPTLAESVAAGISSPQQRKELERLLSYGRLAPSSRLLSLSEHRHLLGKLRPVAARDPALLPRAARAAVPYVDLPEPLRAARIPDTGLDAAVRALEGFGDSEPVPDGTPGVPALLRVVEYVAAGCGGRETDALQGWGMWVAGRLGIHEAALAERRRDAAVWAGGQERRRARVLVALTRHREDPVDRWRCVLWRTRPDGTTARASTGDDRPRTGEEIARLVREVASGEQPGQAVPMVEVVVGREQLHLPVDEWDGAGPAEIVPAALGEDFHVVLRCPEPRRRSRAGTSEWRRRWASRMCGQHLTVDDRFGTEREVIRLLKTSHRDCARVVVHGPPRLRARMLDLCLAMGVPVVLWDRRAEGFGDRRRLDATGPEDALEELPERVRCFRVEAFGAPDEALSGRPALVWEDAEVPLPEELRLTDPWERTETG